MLVLIGPSIRLSPRGSGWWWRGVCGGGAGLLGAEDGRRRGAAGRDSVGHAYLFDILRPEMRFYPLKLEPAPSEPVHQTLDLSRSVFPFFPLSSPIPVPFSLLSMKLAANYGSLALEKYSPPSVNPYSREVR